MDFKYYVVDVYDVLNEKKPVLIKSIGVFAENPIDAKLTVQENLDTFEVAVRGVEVPIQ